MGLRKRKEANENLKNYETKQEFQSFKLEEPHTLISDDC